MATFVPVPNVAEARMIYIDQQNQIAMNTYHWLGSTTWNITTLNSLITSMISWENSTANPAKAVRNINVQLQTVNCRDLSTQNGPVVQRTAGVFGTDTDPPVPNNVTIAVKHVTNVAGRAFRGRSYWIGLTTAQLDATGANQAVTPGTETALLAIYNTFLSGTGMALPNSAIPVVVSRYHGVDANRKPIPRSTGVATAITGYALVDRFLDSQRRRLVGHNRHRR